MSFGKHKVMGGRLDHRSMSIRKAIVDPFSFSQDVQWNVNLVHVGWSSKTVVLTCSERCSFAHSELLPNLEMTNRRISNTVYSWNWRRMFGFGDSVLLDWKTPQEWKGICPTWISENSLDRSGDANCWSWIGQVKVENPVSIPGTGIESSKRFVLLKIYPLIKLFYQRHSLSCKRYSFETWTQNISLFRCI